MPRSTRSSQQRSGGPRRSGSPRSGGKTAAKSGTRSPGKASAKSTKKSSARSGATTGARSGAKTAGRKAASTGTRSSAKSAGKASRAGSFSSPSSGISRIDQPERRTHGYFVRVGYKKTDNGWRPTSTGFFGDVSHGGRRSAWEAAEEWLAKTRRQLSRQK